MAKKKKTKKSVLKVVTENVVTSPIEKTNLYISNGAFWKNHWLKAVCLFVISVILYAQTVDYGYVLDDTIVIDDNQFTSKGVSGIWDIMTTESMTGYFGEQKNLVQGNRFRPLSLVSFAIEIELFGKSPKVAHINNVIIYGITCMILFWMLYLLLQYRDDNRDTWLGIAFVAALLYTIHPIHTEAVANIKGRDEVMALLFSLLAVIGSIKYVYSHKKGYLIGVALVYLLGLLSKENAITFLAIIPASMYFFTPAEKRDYYLVMSTLLITTIAYLGYRFSVAGVPDFSVEITDVMNNPFYGMSGDQKLATISYTLLKYLGLSIVPHPLTHDYYPYAIPILNWGDYRAILGLVAHIGLVVIMFWKWRSKSMISYGILFYLAALSIVSNVVINVGTFMNERFIFISTVGSVLILVYLLLGKLAHRKSPIGKYISYGILGLIIIGYSYKTYTRIPAWESALSLNQSAILVSKNSARANSFMSTALYNQAKTETDRERRKEMYDQAAGYAHQATIILPNYKNAHLMKAGIAAEIHKLGGDLPTLLQSLSEVAVARPDVSFVIEYMDYLKGGRISDEELINWYHKVGYQKLFKEKLNQRWAMHYLTKAFEIDTSNPKINQAIGEVYQYMGDTEKANKFLRAAGIQ